MDDDGIHRIKGLKHQRTIEDLLRDVLVKCGLKDFEYKLGENVPAGLAFFLIQRTLEAFNTDKIGFRGTCVELYSKYNLKPLPNVKKQPYPLGRFVVVSAKEDDKLIMLVLTEDEFEKHAPKVELTDIAPPQGNVEVYRLKSEEEIQ